MQKKYAIFMGLAMELVVLEVGLLYAGHYMDEHHGWGGIGVAAGGLSALGIWIFHLVKATKGLDQQE